MIGQLWSFRNEHFFPHTCMSVTTSRFIEYHFIDQIPYGTVHLVCNHVLIQKHFPLHRNNVSDTALKSERKHTLIFVCLSFLNQSERRRNCSGKMSPNNLSPQGSAFRNCRWVSECLILSYVLYRKIFYSHFSILLQNSFFWWISSEGVVPLPYDILVFDHEGLSAYLCPCNRNLAVLNVIPIAR